MRRALLIGSETNGLESVAHDVVRMDEALALHGFERRTLTESDATRGGILAALKRLTEETAEDDAVLIYYTGHGGLAVNQGRTAGASGGLPGPRYYQYIVPTDHLPTDFRGIFSAELTAIVAGLTARTANVTVVLDCCHSSGTVNSAGRRYRARAVPKPWAGNVAAHVTWLQAQGYDLSAAAAAAEGNPRAIRLVACAAEERAYEYTDPDGTRGGLLTAAFVEVLRASVGGALPVWDAIGMHIRACVSAEMGGQHPDVLGPIGRRLFSLEVTDRVDMFATFVEAGTPKLRAGSLHGVRDGDRFLLLPLDVAAVDRDLALAELEVDAVGVHVSAVKVAALPGRPPAPPGAWAIRTHTEHPRQTVRIVGADGGLAAAITGSPRLTLAAGDRPAVTAVRGPLGTIEVRDEQGTPVRRLAAGDLRGTVRVLEQLARVRVLLDRRGGVEKSWLAAPEVVWARVHAEGYAPLPAAGAALRVDDRLIVLIKNTWKRPIYASVLGVGVDRSIALVSASEPQGVTLAVGEQGVIGQDRAGRIVGIPVTWPAVVPAATQPFALVVVATDVPIDLRAMESEIHDVGELLARFGERPLNLDSTPAVPEPRVCRVAVIHLAGTVEPDPSESLATSTGSGRSGRLDE